MTITINVYENSGSSTNNKLNELIEKVLLTLLKKLEELPVMASNPKTHDIPFFKSNCNTNDLKECVCTHEDAVGDDKFDDEFSFENIKNSGLGPEFPNGGYAPYNV